MYERPVTGSCERCRRAYDLLIPEPGLGDLHLERITARFGWCAGCDRLVGQRCCWVGDADLCADCAAAVSTPGASVTKVSLTGSALHAIAAAASSLAGAEARLGELPVRDVDRARSAWEDAWLEAGALTVRAESAARLVRRRAGSGSGASGRFAALATTWKARSRAMDDRLRDVGRRIRAPSAVDAARTGASNRGPAEVPSPPAAARGGVTTLAKPRTESGRDRVVGTTPPSRKPSANRSAQVTPLRAPSSGLTAPGASAAAVSVPARVAGVAPTGKPMPEAGQVSPSEPLQEPELVPVPMATPAISMPGVETDPESPTATAGQRRRRIAGATAVVLALIGAGVVVATIQRQPAGLGTGAGPSAESVVGDSPSRGAADEPPTPAEPGNSAIPPSLSAPAVGFDLEPLGPLPADAEGVALVLGAPEVAALPTSFDRSLRLEAAGDGVCLAGPPGGSTARSIAFDVLVGGLGTDLVLTPTHLVDETVTVAFDEISGLARGAWYRLRVAWDEDGAISLEVTERHGDETVQRAALQPSGPPDRAATGSICIEADRVPESAALHLDNVRVEA
jgi:hypothetical protein